MMYGGSGDGNDHYDHVSEDFRTSKPLSLVLSTGGSSIKRRKSSRKRRLKKNDSSIRTASLTPSAGARGRLPFKRSSTAPMTTSVTAGAVTGEDDKTLFDIIDIDATPDSIKRPFTNRPAITPLSNDIAATNFNIITINVGGLRFQTLSESLERYPNTLLGDPGRRAPYYNPAANEYFFDRHRGAFESILYIYQSGGRVKRPEPIPIDIFINELKFFEMGQHIMELFWISEGYQKPEELDMPKNKLQRRIWKLMEHPDSSLCARIMAFISVSVIIISIMSFCLETLPALKNALNNRTREDGTMVSHWSNPFYVIEVLCISWFTFEFLARFISCPNKWIFCKSFLNIIDVVAIVPFFINQAFGEEGESSAMSFAVLRVLRLVRVFRIFKLSRHSVGLQILGKTFKASVQEFCLLIFFMVIAIVLFSSGIYFAEGGKGKFTSIPASFWYAVVTMTTVGYGDMVPVTTPGQIVGTCCALIGVLTLALPVPIIVANFKHFYRQETRLAQMCAAEDYQDDAGGSVSS